MRSTEEPLTKRERAELTGYVSWSTAVGRAALFVFSVALVGALCWRVQQWFPVSAPLWLVPTFAVAVLLYVRSRRWTGGRELRERIRLDLQANVALVHRISPRDAIVFEEHEDEGPIVFLLSDDGHTFAFVGQQLARHVASGFPWREFEIREAAHSRRFLRLKRLGEPFPPSATNPPLSRAAYRRLDLASVAFWRRLDVPFDELRRVA